MVHQAPSAGAVIATEWIVLGITMLTIAARLNLRLRIQRRRLLLNDIFICGALLAAVGNAAFDIKFHLMGVLKPNVSTTLEGYQGSPGDVELARKLFWISYFPYMTSFYLAKATLLEVYRQSIPHFMVKRRIFLWAAVGFVISAYMATLLLQFCICLPLERNWIIYFGTGCPMNGLVVVFQVAWALHLFGDILVFVLPWLIVSDMKLQKTLKIGVYLTLLLGVIDIGVCIFRFVMIQRTLYDQSLSLTSLELYGSLDCNIAVLVASLPSLGPYFRRKRRPGEGSYLDSYAGTANQRLALNPMERGDQSEEELPGVRPVSKNDHNPSNASSNHLGVF